MLDIGPSAMLRVLALSLILLLSGPIIDSIARAQATQPNSTRKALIKVSPASPPLARKLNLEGTVKMLVTVAPNGSVKSVEILGGHPLLASAAEIAAYKWKWVPTNQESKEIVEMKFQRQ